jgi:hypothetical protein
VYALLIEAGVERFCVAAQKHEDELETMAGFWKKLEE